MPKENTAGSRKHTPLPYAVPDDYDDQERIVSVDYGSIAYMPDPHRFDDGSANEALRKQYRANAEFIVRACNNHYELLEALTGYVELEEQAAPFSSSPMREKARAAIAKATIKPENKKG